ncbi:MAG: hypothetical protein J6S96_03605 [Muribaculaceae bacterium]|nr:hypothetical protein [Muribaculaceae bacterium]
MKQFVLTALLTAAFLMASAQDSIEWVSDTMSIADSLVVEDIPSETITAEPETVPVAETQPTNRGLGWLVFASALSALLALGAGAMAYLNRRELTEFKETMRVEMENTDKNMRQLAQESAREVNTLRDALRAHLTRVSPADAAVHVSKRQDVPSNEANEPRGPRTIYLAKPDTKDCFTRATSQFELGNSLFALTTTDGVHGSFIVIDNADAQRFALMMPTDNLTRACTGNGIQVSTGKTGIITDVPGEATYDNGVWRITRKAIIHYV